MTKQQGELHRTTVLCIDSYDGGVPAGSFYNAGQDEVHPFRSTMELLSRMEGMLDDLACPQSFTLHREFGPPPEKRSDGPPGERPRRGKLATFGVRILFRQNASWQGSVSWLESGREQTFRSALELLLLLDGALRAS